MAVLPTGIGPVTGGYQIERSLRFNSADSAYLNRTPGSATDRQKWTWSSWVKLGSLTINQMIFSAGATSGANVYAYWNTTNTLSIRFDQEASGNVGVTAAVNRDPSAWYHVVFALDTTQATAANRVKIYINGVQQDTTGSTFPSQNFNTAMNNNVAHSIGRRGYDATSYASFLLSEIIHVDGQQLTPSSFGETDSATGVWKPKAYSGTYGTNGFYLKFADNSGTTSTTLGKDSSGNSNNWTPNNFSVTAGAGNDSLVDSPTAYGTDTGVGGEVRGNYCTLNALDRNSSGTLVNGNLDWSSGTTAHYGIRGTFQLPADKIYFEATVVSNCTASVAVSFGLATASNPLNAGGSSNTGAYQIYSTSSSTMQSAGSGGTTSSALTAGQVLQCAYDGTTNSAWIGINNTYYNFNFGTSSVSPSAGTNPTFSSLPTGLFPFAAAYSNGLQFNFGQRAFAYTAPSGFKALCTTNLPTPTIGATSTTQANDYFDINLWTGTGATNTITNSGSMQPDFVWIKSRTTANSHRLFDAVRGATKTLSSNDTAAEATESDSLTSFNSNGFTLGADTSGGGVNVSTRSYVGWQWNAGGSNATNTSGTITSTVRANTTSGFSIATYTGNGSGGATVGHGLGVSPAMIFTKSRSNSTNWMVWHQNLTANYAFEGLNTTGAETSGGSPSKYVRSVSSTLVTIGNDISVNQSASYTYVMYCFAAVAGYSAFGSYTGNGSTDGPFVYTGFRPRYVMVKRKDSTGWWYPFDTARNTYNVTNSIIELNGALAETTGSNYAIDVLSNGFKLRSTHIDVNTSGGTYIYACFAENPFKYSLAR